MLELRNGQLTLLFVPLPCRQRNFILNLDDWSAVARGDHVGYLAQIRHHL